MRPLVAARRSPGVSGLQAHGEEGNRFAQHVRRHRCLEELARRLLPPALKTTSMAFVFPEEKCNGHEKDERQRKKANPHPVRCCNAHASLLKKVGDCVSCGRQQRTFVFQLGRSGWRRWHWNRFGFSDAQFMKHGLNILLSQSSAVETIGILCNHFSLHLPVASGIRRRVHEQELACDSLVGDSSREKDIPFVNGIGKTCEFLKCRQPPMPLMRIRSCLSGMIGEHLGQVGYSDSRIFSFIYWEESKYFVDDLAFGLELSLTT